MEEENIAARLQALEAKIDTLYVSVEKVRKYFLWSGIITLALILVPMLIIPFFVSGFLAAEGVTLPPGF
jgi:hypothetical protein